MFVVIFGFVHKDFKFLLIICPRKYVDMILHKIGRVYPRKFQKKLNTFAWVWNKIHLHLKFI